MADDIGWFNVSCYNHGVMGYRTPNSDPHRQGRRDVHRLLWPTKLYCRSAAALSLANPPIRTGLTKVGTPGATLGLSAEDPSVGQFMKNFGYATGQFGKNHLGDRNEHLPTVTVSTNSSAISTTSTLKRSRNMRNYPKDPAFRKQVGPRGVMKCKATDKDDTTVDEQFGKVGKQVMRIPGRLPENAWRPSTKSSSVAHSTSLTAKRKKGSPWFLLLQSDAHARFHAPQARIERQNGSGSLPGWEWSNSMDISGIAEEARRSKSRRQHDRCVHDRQRCRSVVMARRWRNSLRGEKDTNWKGGWRVPCVMKWSGVIEPGRVVNDICSLQDFIPTFAAANSEPDLVEKVKKGYKMGDKTSRSILMDTTCCHFSRGKEEKCPREGFIYWSDDGECMAMRMGRYKIVFAEQRSIGLDVWREPLSPMRIPKFFDLRSDPFERGEESFKYNDWFIENIFLQYAAPGLLMKWLESFKEFPPRSKPASFSIDQVMEKMMPKS